MKIRLSRTAGALALASALVVSGLVLAAAPGKSAAPRGQAAEHASMCKFCESTNGACFAPAAGAAMMSTASDAGMQTNTCSYPPCSTSGAKMSGNLAELKLACASCRALCPNVSGAPAVQTMPDQKK